MRLRTQALPVLGGLALSAVVVFAQTLPQGVQKVTSLEGITEYALPNGLHVLLFPDASKPKVTVNMTYLVGSRHEGNGEGGMAHLLEHLLFKTTKGGIDVKKVITEHCSDWNGTTSLDRTNYYETCVANDENLKWAIGLEADRMVNMRIEKVILDPEMTVVRNEFEIGENSPPRILFERVLQSSYTAHNYGKSTIGNRSDIEHVPIDRLAAFYQRYYQPDNAILTIAGQFEEAKALGWIAESFTKIPKPTRKLEPTYTVEPTQDGERTVTLRRSGDNPNIVIAYHGPAGPHPDTAVLDVLTGILGDRPTGRLYKALVDNKKAVNVDMGFETLHDPGFIVAEATLKEDQSLDEAVNAMLKAIEGLAAEPPNKEETERAKTRIIKQMDLSLSNSQTVGVLLSNSAAAGDWRLLFHERDEIKKVTEQDVARVAKHYLKESNRTLGTFVPTKNPDRAEIPPTPDTNTLLKDYKGGEAVAEGEIFDPSPSNIEKRLSRTKLASGAKVTVLPKKTRGKTVVAQMQIRFGDEKSLFGKSVAGQMTGALLMRGTKTKNRQQIQDEMDRLKARLNVGGGANNATVSIETTEENLPGALKLAAEILREPAFPESEFEQVRQQRIAAIEAGRSDPQSLAFRAFSSHLYKDYPRGDLRHVDTPEESIEDWKKVTLDDVKQFYTHFYGASSAELAVSGQCDKAVIEKLAAELFGNWKSPSPYARILVPYHSLSALNTKIEAPDKANAFVIIGSTVKISDEDPDYAAAILANFMLGGSPASRLFKRVRDQEGLTYGIQSSLSAPTKDDGGSLILMAAAQPGNAPKVESSIQDELSRTLKDGFAADEVDAAKKTLLQDRKVGRSQDGALAGLLVARDRYDRTLQWDEAMDAKIASLTAQQVSEAFRKYFGTTAVSIVKAGDFKKAGAYASN